MPVLFSERLDTMNVFKNPPRTFVSIIIAGAVMLSLAIGISFWFGNERYAPVPALARTPLEILPANGSREPEISKSADSVHIQSTAKPALPLPERAEEELSQVQRQSQASVVTTLVRPSRPPVQSGRTTTSERDTGVESPSESPATTRQPILNTPTAAQSQTSDSSEPQESPALAFELAPGVVEPAAFYGDESTETPAQVRAANAIAANLIENVEEAAATGDDETLAAVWDAEKEAADSNYRAIFGVSQYLLYSTEAAANALNSATQ